MSGTIPLASDWKWPMSAAAAQTLRRQVIPAGVDPVSVSTQEAQPKEEPAKQPEHHRGHRERVA
jgi:hypothetical protein